MFWTLNFKQELLGGLLAGLRDRIAAANYEIAGVWYPGTINSKMISGAVLLVKVDLPGQAQANTITGLRILDSDNQILSDTAVSIYRPSNQGLLINFKSTITSDGEALDVTNAIGYILIEDAVSTNVNLYALPNYEYRYSARITSLNLSFAPPVADISSEYVIQFNTGQNPIINIEGNIKWYLSPPTFAANSSYRLSFIPLGGNDYFGIWLNRGELPPPVESEASALLGKALLGQLQLGG